MAELVDGRYGLSSVNRDGMPRAQGQVGSCAELQMDEICVDFRQVSIAMFTCVVLVVTLRLAIDTQFWTWLHALFYLGSIFMW